MIFPAGAPRLGKARRHGGAAGSMSRNPLLGITFRREIPGGAAAHHLGQSEAHGCGIRPASALSESGIAAALTDPRLGTLVDQDIQEWPPRAALVKFRPYTWQVSHSPVLSSTRISPGSSTMLWPAETPGAAEGASTSDILVFSFHSFLSEVDPNWHW